MSGRTEPFAAQLRRLRAAAGLSQEALAERAGLTAGGVGALEREERRHPYPQTVRALADGLGLGGAERAAFFAAVPARARSRAAPAGLARRGFGPRLPALPATALVARERELAAATELLKSGPARILTVAGPGGVGKTRLALELASRLASHFASTAAWVDLSTARDAELVLPAIADSLGLPERTAESVADVLAGFLRDKKALLVLDTFEHVLDAAADVARLSESCPGLAILVTSRQSLGLRGEQELRLEPLSLEANEGGVAGRPASEALRLLLDRAQAALPDFALSDENAGSLQAICARLDGVPLAIELAAVHLRALSPAQLLERLEERLGLLAGGLRDLPARQRSLRATIGWSYALLTAPEQELFRRLAVFEGGFTLAAVEHVCAEHADAAPATLATLEGLVDKSLVRVSAVDRGEVRFSTLDTIAEFARERLRESGEGTKLEARHGEHFCRLAESAAPHLSGASREPWMQRLDGEHGNLSAALRRASTGDRCLGERLVGALGWFWSLRANVVEGTRWVERLVVAEEQGCDPAIRGAALYTAAAMAWKRDELPLASRLAAASVTLRQAAGDRRGAALSLAVAGHVAVSQGDLTGALRAYEESLQIFRERGESWGIAYALANLADARFQAGETATARAQYAEALAGFTAVGDPWGRMIVLHTLGNLALAENDGRLARERYGDSVELGRIVGNRQEVGRSLIGLAAAALAQGDAEEAQRNLRESLAIWQDYGIPSAIALCLAGFAAIETARDNLAGAVALFGAAEALRLGRPPLFVVRADLFSAALEVARTRMDAAAFAEAWATGASSPLAAVLGQLT